jgi:hypothetical protein
MRMSTASCTGHHSDFGPAAIQKFAPGLLPLGGLLALGVTGF